VTGSSNLTFNANAAAGIAISGAVGTSGSITNSGTEAGTTTISSNLGSSITGVTQNSATSALLLATLQTPWRFRTKRHLWAYAGLAVVQRASAEYELDGQRRIRRRRRAGMTRGLNPNHNRTVKAVFKGAATAAATRPGALQDWYQELLKRGLREELARVTLARKLAALTLRLWKHGGRYDGTQLTVQAGHAR